MLNVIGVAVDSHCRSAAAVADAMSTMSMTGTPFTASTTSPTCQPNCKARWSTISTTTESLILSPSLFPSKGASTRISTEDGSAIGV